MSMSNITFEVPRLSIFIFQKCSEKRRFRIIFVVSSLKGLGWNNVCRASQTVAQHYFITGPMYRVIRVVAFLETSDASVTGIAIAPVLCHNVCTQNVACSCWAIVSHVASTLKQCWFAV